MMKKITGAFLIAALATGFCVNAYAAEWKQDNTGWWYQKDDGSYPVSSWHWLDGNADGNAECYYFNEKGYLLTGTKTPDGYEVNADGAWVVNNQVQIRQAAQAAASEAANETMKKAVAAISKSYLGRLYRTEAAKGAKLEADRSYSPSMSGEWLGYIFWDCFRDSGFSFTFKEEEIFFKPHKGNEGKQISTSVTMNEFSEFFADAFGKNVNIVGLERAFKEGIMGIGSSRNTVAVNPNVANDIDRIYTLQFEDYAIRDGKLVASGKYEVHTQAGELIENGDIVSTFYKNETSYFGYTSDSALITPRFVK
ncbi:MAG: hypothetical protein Q4A19_00750 [Johnsonella sp.]|nr:hypothetical protein [Johnsonella sp.]